MAKPEETVDAEPVEQIAPDDPAVGEESSPAKMTGAEYIGAALERLGFEPDDDAEDYEEYIESPDVEEIEQPIPAAVAPKIVRIGPAPVAVASSGYTGTRCAGSNCLRCARHALHGLCGPKHEDG